MFERLGWAGGTPGGDGGAVIRVTTLVGDGPGSFRAAVTAKGPRTVVFDVAGVIDLGRKNIRIVEPFLTIAGETAPSPGVTLIKGDLAIQTHDVIVRHLRVRAGRDGAAARSGWEVDGITCWKAHDVIVDHCSITLGHRREPVGLGPAFTGGEDPEGLAGGDLAPDHLQQQHRRRGAVERQPREGRAFQGQPDPRQRHGGADRRQPLRPQPRAQPAVQGRGRGGVGQQPDLRSGHRAPCTTR